MKIIYRQLAPVCLSFLVLFSCNKKPTGCENPSNSGRIIGYHPCRYYSPSGTLASAPLVVEINVNGLKDTLLAEGIPNEGFDFPEIDRDAALRGEFLYAEEDHAKLHFRYEEIWHPEPGVTPCPAIANPLPFEAAVKNRNGFFTCVKPQ